MHADHIFAAQYNISSYLSVVFANIENEKYLLNICYTC